MESKVKEKVFDLQEEDITELSPLIWMAIGEIVSKFFDGQIDEFGDLRKLFSVWRGASKIGYIYRTVSFSDYSRSCKWGVILINPARRYFAPSHGLRQQAIESLIALWEEYACHKVMLDNLNRQSYYYNRHTKGKLSRS